MTFLIVAAKYWYCNIHAVSLQSIDLPSDDWEDTYVSHIIVIIIEVYGKITGALRMIEAVYFVIMLYFGCVMRVSPFFHGLIQVDPGKSVSCALMLCSLQTLPNAGYIMACLLSLHFYFRGCVPR